jgi:hypothetical protein
VKKRLPMQPTHVLLHFPFPQGPLQLHSWL